jgi:hypothetical protein
MRKPRGVVVNIFGELRIARRYRAVGRRHQIIGVRDAIKTGAMVGADQTIFAGERTPSLPVIGSFD